MLPEDYADMVERLGHPRPPLPAGIEVVNALEFESVMALAETHPDVGRVLHLIDFMLVGDEEIDWVTGYAALEIVEEDLRARGLDGQALGWWTNADAQDSGPPRTVRRHWATALGTGSGPALRRHV